LLLYPFYIQEALVTSFPNVICFVIKHEGKGGIALRRKTMRFCIAIGMAMLLVSIALAPLAVQADVVWSDDFDDENFDGWDYTSDRSTAEGGYYHMIWAPGESDFYWRAWILRTSTLCVGSWSFDITDMGGMWEVSVSFVSSNPYEDPHNCYFFSLGIGSTQTGLQYLYTLGRDWTGRDWLELDSYDGLERADLSGTVHHIKVTRSSSGQMAVLLNGTVILRATDTVLDTSEYFEIELHRGGSAIDNIIVDDSPPLDSLPILLAVAGGAAIVVVAAVIIMKRR